MGDSNQTAYLNRHVPRLEGPVLEIGSKDYGNTASSLDCVTPATLMVKMLCTKR